MNPKDEKEFQRLSQLLQEIDQGLAAESPQREALVKASLALGMIFLQDGRGEIERVYADLEPVPVPTKRKKEK